jgi:CRP-like cAMP-binding protein
LLNHAASSRPDALSGPGPHRNLLLERLPPASRERLLCNASLVPLQFRSWLFQQGDRIESVYFPVSGLASVVLRLADGHEVEVAVVGSEGFIGVPVVLGRNAMNVDVVVQGRGEAVKVPATAVSRLAQECAASRAVLLQYVHAALVHVQTTAACNRVHPLVQRLARWLLLCHDRMGEDRFAMTHEFLAQMLGVRRAGVTVAAETLQQLGAIDYRRGHIAILDRARLQGQSCECYVTSRDTFLRLLSGT